MTQCERDRDILLAIQAILDGAEWSPDTLDDIASALHHNGYPIKDLSHFD